MLHRSNDRARRPQGEPLSVQHVRKVTVHRGKDHRGPRVEITLSRPPALGYRRLGWCRVATDGVVTSALEVVTPPSDGPGAPTPEDGGSELLRATEAARECAQEVMGERLHWVMVLFSTHPRSSQRRRMLVNEAFLQSVLAAALMSVAAGLEGDND